DTALDELAVDDIADAAAVSQLQIANPDIADRAYRELRWIVRCAQPRRSVRDKEGAAEVLRRIEVDRARDEPGGAADGIVGEQHRELRGVLLRDGDTPSVLLRTAPPHVAVGGDHRHEAVGVGNRRLRWRAESLALQALRAG